jgi:hypothetical protein
MNLSETEKAYIAGLVDGEGTIGMAKTHEEKGDRQYRYRLRFNIAMTDLEVMMWLAQITRAKLGAGRCQNPKKHAKAYRIAFSEIAGEDLVRQIEPYLKVKRQQALMYLRYREVQKFSLAHRTAHRNQIKSIRELRDWFYDEFRRLNHRGPKSVTTNTPDMLAHENAVMKIESDLRGDMQRVTGDSAPPSIH